MAKPDLIEDRLQFAEGKLHGFFCRPASEGPHPLVLMLPDIYGLREQARDTARNLAVKGFAVFAPHLLARLRKTPFDPRKEAKEAAALSRGVPEAQVRKDIDAALEAASASEGVDPARKAIWGYCWGGSLVFPTLADRNDLKAGVVFYGDLPEERSATYQRRPFDCVSTVRSRMILHYGDADAFVPLERVRQLQALLRSNAVHTELHLYAGGDHAFCDDTRDHFLPEAAALAWERTIKFLERHLAAP